MRLIPEMPDSWTTGTKHDLAVAWDLAWVAIYIVTAIFIAEVIYNTYRRLKK